MLDCICEMPAKLQGSHAPFLSTALGMQLRELAALNGTLKDEQYCFICGESGAWRRLLLHGAKHCMQPKMPVHLAMISRILPCCSSAGHQQSECPKKAVDVYRLPDQLQTKVDEMYAKVGSLFAALA